MKNEDGKDMSAWRTSELGIGGVSLNDFGPLYQLYQLDQLDTTTAHKVGEQGQLSSNFLPSRAVPTDRPCAKRGTGAPAQSNDDMQDLWQFGAC